MSSFVFYCKNCEKTFAGEDYQASDKPCCPKCHMNTVSTGITKELWIQKTKEERQELLEVLIREEEQRAQNAARPKEYAQAAGVTRKGKDKEDDSGYLDDLYIDIGKKIKGWAKWIFIVEAIAFGISGVGMLFAAEDGWMFFAGLLTLVIGPLVAWVSSWILYAFGELVEKTSANEQNTRNILKRMQENNAKKDKN